ncbi:ATP-binding protein [Streptosporangium amethystogenes]|uniref:ATP-binding protein n=1 Tax=Streptosporangium amethystogenes TaxID=2002 RepID=UPI00379EA360
MRISHRRIPVTGPHAQAMGGLHSPDDGRIHIKAWCLSGSASARKARALLRSRIAGHLTDEAVLGDLDLMICELTANAHRHAEGPREMRILYHEGIPVIYEIADAGGDLDLIVQRLRLHSGQAEIGTIDDIDALQIGGRGLGIVARLSGGRCGAYTTRLCGTGQPGKSVWFALPVKHAPN